MVVATSVTQLSHKFSRHLLVTTVSLMSVAALSSTTAQCSISVSERLHLSETLKTFDLQSAPLYPIDFVLGSTIQESSTSVPSGDVIQKHLGENGAICFVVRRPGCVFCREEGVALSDLSKDPELKGFGFFGTVKETGVDNEGLVEFAKTYPFPLYRDGELRFYEALGNRKLTMETWNPIRIVNGIFWLRNAMKRVSDRKLEGNLKGEGLKKGGVIIFGKDGKPKYAYAEETFEELPSAEILEAIKAVKAEQ